MAKRMRFEVTFPQSEINESGMENLLVGEGLHLEYYVRRYLSEFLPSALPFADLIQNDVLAVLKEVRATMISSMTPDGSYPDGR